MLTGIPGNVTNSWEGGGLLTHLVRCGRWGRALREARALSPDRWCRTLFTQGLLPLMPDLIRNAAWRLRHGDPRTAWHAYCPIHPEFARAHDVEARARRLGQGPAQSTWRDPSIVRRDFFELGNTFGYYDSAFRSAFGVEMTRQVHADFWDWFTDQAERFDGVSTDHARDAVRPWCRRR